MKKLNSISVAIIIAFSFLRLNVFAQNKSETKNVAAKKIVYTCPMHSDVTSDKPGKCPKCNMNLVQKNSNKKMNMVAMVGNPFFEKSVDRLKFQG